MFKFALLFVIDLAFVVPFCLANAWYSDSPFVRVIGLISAIATIWSAYLVLQRASYDDLISKIEKDDD